MLSNCFAPNYILLKGDCNTYTTQSSGLYINDLPGLSFKLLSNLSNEEQKNASTLYQVSHNEGIARFIRDFKTGISSDFQYKNVLSSGKHGRIAETFSGVGDKKIGKEVERLNCNDRFQCLYLEYLELKVDSDQTVVFEIHDDCDQTDYSQDLTCGVNRVYLNYEARSDKVQVVYNATGVSLPDDLHCWNTGSNCRCDDCVYDGGFSGFSVTDVEESGATFIDSNQENGLRIAVSTRCSVDELLCVFFNESARTIRLAIGIDIIRRVLSSDRTNPLLRTKKEQADEILIEWEGGKSGITGFTHKGEYHKGVQSIITQAQSYLRSQTGNTKCLSCSGKRIEYIKP